MSNIDAQIKALQLKKKKIDYLSYIADLIKNDTKCHDFKDVQKEIVGKVEPILVDLMTAVENDSELKASEESQMFTASQVEALKSLADRVLSKPVTPVFPGQSQTQTVLKPQQPAPPHPPVAELSPQEKMNFAMANRHLAAKRVQVLNDHNTQIYGQVVGLDAPNIIVKTDTGPTIHVPQNKVNIINE